ESGQGFFWYLYDRTFTPNPTPGNGTSTSIELTGFELTATGTVPSADVMYSPPNYASGPVKQGAPTSRSFLIGNPFGQDLNVGGISSTPARQAVLQTWDPQAGSYVMFESGGANEVLAVWQGTIAEISDPDTAPTFTFDEASRTGGATATFYGRPALLPDAISLRLLGRVEGGVSVADNIAVIRFAEGASAGWDLLDATKLLPPTEDFALLAPVLTRSGVDWRSAVTTLPAESVTVPVQFTASGAGTFAIGADVTLFGGTTAILRDLLTGAEHDFASGEYTFEADATDWADRFEIVVSFASTAGEAGADDAFRMSAPAPNPSSASAQVWIETALAQTVRAAVYDALGREVAVLHEGPLAAGARTALTVDTAALAPGVYVVRAQGEATAITHRLTVTR
ncbi:MAG: T9SS type A sorting domain-containing protein, partial [Bacteroidota bacterium]